MYENVLPDNIVVGYYGEKAIVMDEYGTLFYFECPEKVIPIGSVSDAEVKAVSELSEEEQMEIQRRLED